MQFLAIALEHVLAAVRPVVMTKDRCRRGGRHQLSGLFGTDLVMQGPICFARHRLMHNMELARFALEGPLQGIQELVVALSP